MKKRMAVVTGLTALAVIGPLAGVASAQETDLAAIVLAVDQIWLVLAAALVMFMQAPAGSAVVNGRQ